ncbi:DUF2264 domain-containing protein [Salipaludibacillus sp. HK11]|uniref:DUF2264 domain-containing protein n=1 Tax=Salipaludibacillus sp. HK11 TaxID=3394320 RepID=UPI0039FCC563
MKAFDLPIATNPLQTKQDLQQALKQLVHPLKSSYSKGSAHIHVGNTGAAYPDSIAEMEAFSRVLWGMAPLLAGGEDDELWETCLEGIKNGTNPSHDEYWGEIHDYDQRIVEMAVYGYALSLIPDKLWDPLTDQEKQNFASWLSQINDCKAHDCNWLFFPVLVNIGLKKVGATYNQQTIEQNLDRIDNFYLSDGWYADGIDAHSDYYVPFALHYYGLFYAKIIGKEDPTRSDVYKERAKLFAQHFIYWFAEDGSAIPYGRSLTYRFSQVAFWSAIIFADVKVFPLGITKGIILNHLRWWFKQPIFTKDGLLTIGYTYPNQIMAENYNSPGSPYWSLKTFLILALKDDHPFWQAKELPLPELDASSVQEKAHLVLCRQAEPNHILAFNSGHLSTNDHTHTSAKYEKFVYSNVFGFSVPRAEWKLEQGAFDSTLALSEGDNIYRVKRSCEEIQIDNDIIYARWKPWSDVVVNTWILPGAPIHLRIHCIDSARDIDFAEGGFALGLDNIGHDQTNVDIAKTDELVLTSLPWGQSGIQHLYGGGKAESIYPQSNTNVMSARTVIPTVTGKLSPGKHWLVTSVFAEPGNSQTTKWQNAYSVETKGEKIIVTANSSKHIVFQKKV